MKAIKILEKYHACEQARKWAGDKEAKEAWETCDKGAWMIWIAFKILKDDPILYCVTAMLAHTAIQYMDDKRSRDAVWATFQYGRRKLTKEDLLIYRDSANVATYTAFAAIDAIDADDAAAYAAYAAAFAAFAASAAVDTDDAAATYAVIEKKQADICRKYLTEKIFEKIN